MRKLTLTIAILAAGWSIWLVAFGGGQFDVLGLRIRSYDAFRPLLICGIALAAHISVAGSDTRQRWLAMLHRVSARVVVGILALATLTIGVKYNTTSAGGADAYGYVSQADLWITGDLRVPQPWVDRFPWPSPEWTSSPLGYKPLKHNGQWVIVPTYSPGLPLLMAATKAIAGHAAMFWVVPLCGCLLVLATYGLGARLGLRGAGLAGAWLTATSPPFLYTVILPWSDVPAAAAWTISFYFLLGNTSWASAVSGLAAALAIVIRPNLVWAVAVFGSWFLIKLWRQERRGRLRALRDGLIYAVAASIGVVATAVIYRYFYGSPFESGYGRFADNFVLSRIPTNLRHYVVWLWETRAVAFFLGIVFLFVPIRRIWPKTPDRFVFVPIDLFVFGVWLMYCSYLVFENWPFLRFLLPVYPLAMIAAGAAVLAAGRSRGPGASLAAIGLLVTIGLFFQLQLAVKSGTFGLSRTERRYVAAAQFAREWTPQNAVIFSLGHSGSARYYGGRITLRYDMLQPDWLDRSVEWLQQRGAHPYLLVDQHELHDFQRRFDGQQTLGCTKANPLFKYDGPGTVVLYDLVHDNGAPTQMIAPAFNSTRSVGPAPPATLALR